MSLPLFLNDLIHANNEFGPLHVSIVVDNARLTQKPRRRNSTDSHPDLAFDSTDEDDYWIQDDNEFSVIANRRRRGKKIHPDLLKVRTLSDATLPMPRRRMGGSSSFQQLPSDSASRWSHHEDVLRSTSQSMIARKRQHRLHNDKCFGDSALTMPTRVLSPTPSNIRSPKSNATSAAVKDNILLYTTSALAIVAMSRQEEASASHSSTTTA